MHSFERATCVHYAEGEFSIDSGADIDLEEVAAACHESRT